MRDARGEGDWLHFTLFDGRSCAVRASRVYAVERVSDVGHGEGAERTCIYFPGGDLVIQGSYESVIRRVTQTAPPASGQEG